MFVRVHGDGVAHDLEHGDVRDAVGVTPAVGEVYSPEHTPRMRVVDAVRRSMSIPLFFTAIRDDRDDVFVDGGDVDVWANGILASDTEDPAGITVYMRGSGTTFTVRANGEFTGSLIAPDSELKVRSGGEFTGMFIVDELSLKSSTEVHIDQCLVDAYTLTDLRPTLPGGSVLVQ